MNAPTGRSGSDAYGPGRLRALVVLARRYGVREALGMAWLYVRFWRAVRAEARQRRTERPHA